MGYSLELLKEKVKPNKKVTNTAELQPSSFWGGGGGYGYGGFGYAPVFPAGWNGETTAGEAGPMIKYFTDQYGLTIRARQAFIEQPFIQGLCKKMVRWLVGDGLSLKSEPKMNIVGDGEVTEKYNKDQEAFWTVYANSKQADIANQMTLHELCDEACRESVVSGDILVILRVVNGIVKVQHIDRMCVVNPPTVSVNVSGEIVWVNGNRIRNGVEINADGRHIAYHVRDTLLSYRRVLAYEPTTGMRMAYLTGLFKLNVNDTRSIPIFASGIQMAKMTSQMAEYALQGAKGRQAVSYVIQRELGADAGDPQIGQKFQARRNFNGLPDNNPNNGLSTDVNGIDLTPNKVAIGGNTVYNLGEGQKIETLDSAMDTNVEAFCMFHFKVIAMMVNMPICVAMSEYNDSFSASRMAAKDWERTFLTMRQSFAQQYLDPIYALQTYINIFTGVIDAPVLMKAFNEGNTMAIEAHLFCRWVGCKMPDIDPLKTVNYIRKALGVSLDHVPIMSPEQAVEELGNGTIEDVLRESADTLTMADELEIEPLEQELSGSETEMNDKEEKTNKED